MPAEAKKANIVVYICSPYSGDVKRNEERAAVYCRYAAHRGYTPIAPHLMYPRFLDDEKAADREAAFRLDFSLITRCDQLWVCGDVISAGMEREIRYAEEIAVPIRRICQAEVDTNYVESPGFEVMAASFPSYPCTTCSYLPDDRNCVRICPRWESWFYREWAGIRAAAKRKSGFWREP